jgi:hypothetical protein
MQFEFSKVYRNKFFFKLALWFRGLLSENKIPAALFQCLKRYSDDLSENIPDIEKVNKQLGNDIYKINNNDKSKKVSMVKIVDYQDIIELNEIRDRVFVLDIQEDNNKGFMLRYNPDLKYSSAPLYYKVKLSSLVCVF